MEEVYQARSLTLIALPYVSKDGFVGPCVESLLNAIATKSLGSVSFMCIKDRTQVSARNLAAHKALQIGADYLWFIDSDQDFSVDMLARLKRVDADVACADMWSRSWPSFRIVFGKEPAWEGGKARYLPVGDEIANKGSIENIEYCGMGCTLIKTSMLAKLKEAEPNQPWFWAADHGEDATFCFKVLEAGGTVKCDFGLKSGHWGNIRMMGQDYTRRPVE